MLPKRGGLHYTTKRFSIYFSGWWNFHSFHLFATKQTTVFNLKGSSLLFQSLFMCSSFSFTSFLFCCMNMYDWISILNRTNLSTFGTFHYSLSTQCILKIFGQKCKNVLTCFIFCLVLHPMIVPWSKFFKFWFELLFMMSQVPVWFSFIAVFLFSHFFIVFVTMSTYTVQQNI